ncbi:Amine sulfotransferase [Bulinus truncatus]|nr:Amine sulfotransferase [Bulinus truncatus]
MSTATKGKSEKRNLPSIVRKPSVEPYGWRVLTFPGTTDAVAQVEKIRNLTIREDDVIIAAYPKCGTNWLWEVTQMLLRQTVEYETRTKVQLMLESPNGPERAEAELSPRILNSHNVVAHWPQEIISKKTKIIHAVRNPKDTLVSLFYHCRGMCGGDTFTFTDLLEAALDDDLVWPSQIDYLHQMSEFELNHPDHPIKHVYYEDMKKDFMKTIKDLASFLNVSASEELCQNIASACRFDNMKTYVEGNGKHYPRDHLEAMGRLKGKIDIYRKGQIGDWKNHFTVSQNERFDEFIEKAMKSKKLKFKFIYQ